MWTPENLQKAMENNLHVKMYLLLELMIFHCHFDFPANVCICKKYVYA